MKKINLWLAILLVLPTSCREKTNDYNFSAMANIIVNQLSDKELIGQLFALHLPLKPSEKIIREVLPGSIFLDYRNIPHDERDIRRQSSEKLTAAIESVNQYYLAKKLPQPLYSIDQEAGFHKLLVDAEMFPTFMATGQAVELNNNFTLVEQLAFYTCEHLKQHGIDWNLSPVTDVQSNPENPVIRVRSFGSNARQVTQLAQHYLKGLHKARCIDSIKHFPGHGNTSLDSHLNLPTVDKSNAALAETELLPFKMLTQNGFADSVMSAHIIYKQQDDMPATLSKYWLTTVLRKNMNFQGVIITDNLAMQAIPKFIKEPDYAKIAILSLQAGADMLLLTSFVEKYSMQMQRAILTALKNNTISKKHLQHSASKNIILKLRSGTLDNFLKQNYTKEPEAKKILLYSKTQDQKAARYRKSLPTSQSLNKTISQAAIRFLQQGFLHDIKQMKNMKIYADVSLKNPLVQPLIKNGYTVLPLSSLGRKDYQKSITILNLGKRKNLRKILSHFQKKKKPWLLISAFNPFPLKKIGAKLQKDDSFMVSFSRTAMSKKALVRVFFRNALPKASSIRYIQKMPGHKI